MVVDSRSFWSGLSRAQPIAGFRGMALGASILFLALAGSALLAPAVHAQTDEDEPQSADYVPVPVPMPAETAGGEPRVYVVSVAMDDSLEAIAQRAGAAARHSLRQLEGADWRSADQLFLGYDESALSVLARARDQLVQGRQAYLNLELGQAIDLLTGAIADFDAASSALEDPQDLGDALLYLGASLAFEGRSRDAQRVFGRMHVQMPHIQPDPNIFSPEVVERFESARPRDASSPEASIHVDSDPPGAIAYVDFVARGVTPIDVGGLRGGDHVVRVTRVGATPYVQSLSVRSRRSEATSAMLVDDDRTQGLADALARVRDDDIETIGDATREVATILGLDRIAVIRVSGTDGDAEVSLELIVFDVATGRRLVRGAGAAPVEIGAFEPAVERAVEGGLQASLTHVEASDGEEPVGPIERPPVLTPTTPSEGGSIAEEWWFWTLIGGVLVAGAIGVGVGVAVSDTGPQLGANPGGVVVVEF